MFFFRVFEIFHLFVSCGGKEVILCQFKQHENYVYFYMQRNVCRINSVRYEYYVASFTCHIHNCFPTFVTVVKLMHVLQMLDLFLLSVLFDKFYHRRLGRRRPHPLSLYVYYRGSPLPLHCCSIQMNRFIASVVLWLASESDHCRNS